MFTQQFTKDQDTWRRSRPEYAALLAAIRTDKPDAELVALAADAGTSGGEISELRGLRKRATSPQRKERAAKCEKLSKDMAVLNGKIAEKKAELAAAKTPRQAKALEAEIYGLVEKRQTLSLVLADSAVAAACVEAARSAGVI